MIMKKIIFGIVALFIATFGLYAFSNANFEKKVNEINPVLHWFDANTEEYLGQRTEAQQRSICGPDGDTPCADAYTNVAGDSPAGSFVMTMDKQ